MTIITDFRKMPLGLRRQLVEYEGWCNIAYPGPLTGADPWTIGVGHTGPEVCKGLVWSDELVDKTLTEDIVLCHIECTENFPWLSQLNEPRQAVILGMCFQMGISRLLKFQNTLASARDQRWANAGEGMRQSQ